MPPRRTANKKGSAPVQKEGRATEKATKVSSEWWEGLSPMSRFKEHPRLNCVSTRLTDDEFDGLLHICDKTSRTVSDLVRQAVSSLLVENGMQEGAHRSDL